MSTQEDFQTHTDAEPPARGPDVSDEFHPDEPRRPGRARQVARRLCPWLIVLALVGGGLAAYFVFLQRSSSESMTVESGEARTLTETVTVRDLIEQESFEGTLAYEGATNLANQGTGTVTQLAAEGSTVVAGESLYFVDGVPVVLMHGTAPAWRTLGLALDDEAITNHLSGTITKLSAEGKIRSAGEVLYRVEGEPVVLMEGTVPSSRSLGLTLDDQPVVTQLPGTITKLSAEGKIRSAGDVLYRVDQQPVVLMDGTVPAWRSLSRGVAKGADVRQLEENLVALGYDPDREITVDRSFDYATYLAVLRWQEDLGVPENGIVGFGDVVFLEGEQKVVAQGSATSAVGTSSVGVGAAVQPGSEILRVARRSALEPGTDIRQLEENLVALGYDPDGKIAVDARFTRSTEVAVERWQRDVGAEVDGVVDLGEVVFQPGEQRVVAHASDNSAGSSGATVGVGSTVQPGGEILRLASLASAPEPGQDILQLEENLMALGYNADGALTVDLEFDAATEAAVRSWQRDVGLEDDGIVGLGDVVFLPGPQRVEDHLTVVGSAAQPGVQVLAVTSVDQVVTLDLEADRQSLVGEGSIVAVEFPDGTTSRGTVTAISTVVTQPAQTDGAATVEVTIELAETTMLELSQAPVDVLITTESRTDVLAVPVTALIALAGGGFAVEVVDGDATKLVAVDPGLFSVGYVEVSNTPLAPGDQVVLPQG